MGMNAEIRAVSAAEIEDEIWDLLKSGASNHKSAFHTATIATVGDTFPFIRTVVLRAATREEKSLRFHTDIRSPKIQHLEKNPNISWLFYDKELRIQVRIKAQASIHISDEVAELSWEQSRVSAKMCYTTTSGPGTLIEAPELIQFNVTEMTIEDASFARSNFAVVLSTIQSMDILFLHHSGHKRFLIDYEKGLQSWVQV